MKRVGVLVVDDSALCRQIIIDALSTDPGIVVIGAAENGEQAVALAVQLQPDVITMDLEMPTLDGIAATERIMAERPTPILMLTADPRKQGPTLTHRALSVGALALRIKPQQQSEADAADLAQELKLLSHVRVVRHLRAHRARGGDSAVAISTPAVRPISALGIVSSTGGPQVLHRLVSDLPADFSIPIAIVQHINPAFVDSLATWLAGSTKLEVRVAQDGDRLTPGVIHLAPAGAHLRAASRGLLSVREGTPYAGHLPSGTHLLESLATVFGPCAAGLILSGMGDDGADGLAAIFERGGVTLAQSEQSCVVYGMPRAVIDRSVVTYVVDGDSIAAQLVELSTAAGGDAQHALRGR
jgi:two-component system chemotaxis response regulator CheB